MASEIPPSRKSDPEHRELTGPEKNKGGAIGHQHGEKAMQAPESDQSIGKFGDKSAILGAEGKGKDGRVADEDRSGADLKEENMRERTQPRVGESGTPIFSVATDTPITPAAPTPAILASPVKNGTEQYVSTKGTRHLVASTSTAGTSIETAGEIFRLPIQALPVAVSEGEWTCGKKQALTHLPRTMSLKMNEFNTEVNNAVLHASESNLAEPKPILAQGMTGGGGSAETDSQQNKEPQNAGKELGFHGTAPHMCGNSKNRLDCVVDNHFADDSGTNNVLTSKCDSKITPSPSNSEQQPNLPGKIEKSAPTGENASINVATAAITTLERHLGELADDMRKLKREIEQHRQIWKTGANSMESRRNGTACVINVNRGGLLTVRTGNAESTVEYDPSLVGDVEMHFMESPRNASVGLRKRDVHTHGETHAQKASPILVEDGGHDDVCHPGQSEYAHEGPPGRPAEYPSRPDTINTKEMMRPIPSLNQRTLENSSDMGLKYHGQHEVARKMGSGCFHLPEGSGFKPLKGQISQSPRGDSKETKQVMHRRHNSQQLNPSTILCDFCGEEGHQEAPGSCDSKCGGDCKQGNKREPVDGDSVLPVTGDVPSKVNSDKAASAANPSTPNTYDLEDSGLPFGDDDVARRCRSARRNVYVPEQFVSSADRHGDIDGSPLMSLALAAQLPESELRSHQTRQLQKQLHSYPARRRQKAQGTFQGNPAFHNVHSDPVKDDFAASHILYGGDNLSKRQIPSGHQQNTIQRCTTAIGNETCNFFEHELEMQPCVEKSSGSAHVKKDENGNLGSEKAIAFRRTKNGRDEKARDRKAPRARSDRSGELPLSGKQSKQEKPRGGPPRPHPQMEGGQLWKSIAAGQASPLSGKGVKWRRESSPCLRKSDLMQGTSEVVSVLASGGNLFGQKERNQNLHSQKRKLETFEGLAEQTTKEEDCRTPKKKRFRDNWTAEEDEVFFKMAKKNQTLSDPEIARLLVEQLAPRRTYQQVKGHLKNMRAACKL